MQDVIVVGAGPAGSIAARSLAGKNYDVTVVEEHKSPGVPQHCAGLMTERAISLSGVKPDILSSIYAFELVFPNGRRIYIRSREPRAKVVDRVDLDMRMADAAINAGARFSFDDRFESYGLRDAVFAKCDSGIHKARMIVGADGQGSRVASALGDNIPEEYVRGIQTDVSVRPESPDTMRIYLGEKVAPGFFAWEIPCGDFVRIGLATKWSAGPPTEYFSDLLIRLGYQKDVGSKLYVGKIPLGGRPYTYGDRCLLAGDAAGFVDPITGCGLTLGLEANKHLVSTASSCLDSGTLYARELSEYERSWKEALKKNVLGNYTVRKKFLRLDDLAINDMYSRFSTPESVERLEVADLDNLGDVFRTVSSRSIFSRLSRSVR